MLAYLLKNVIWNPSIIKICLLLCASALVCLVAYFILQIIHKQKKLTFDEYIPIEQAVVALLISIWSFGLLCLPLALIVWLLFYFVYPKLSFKNRIMTYSLKFPSKSYNPIIMEKHFRSMPCKTLIKEIFLEKKKVKESVNDISKIKVSQKGYMPARIYFSGIIVYFILAILEPNTMADSGFIGLVFLENLIMFLGLFYAFYLALYLVEVKYCIGRWYNSPKYFNFFAIIFLLVGIVIVSAITFLH